MTSTVCCPPEEKRCNATKSKVTSLQSASSTVDMVTRQTQLAILGGLQSPDRHTAFALVGMHITPCGSTPQPYPGASCKALNHPPPIFP